MINLVKKSKSRYRDTVISHLNFLIKKLTKIRTFYNLKPAPTESEQLQKLQQLSPVQTTQHYKILAFGYRLFNNIYYQNLNILDLKIKM